MLQTNQKSNEIESKNNHNINLETNKISCLKEEEILNLLKSSKDGLTQEDANKRLTTYGKNVLNEKKELNIILEFLSHFKNPLIIILLIATTVSITLGEMVDSIIIIIMILLSVSLDFVLERNANNAAKKLKEKIQTTATVLRDGKEIEIPNAELCRGDIIILQAGSMIPADARILQEKDFFVNQSALTGESFPCEKSIEINSNPNASISEMKNIIFLGTSVTSGTAKAIIIKTGNDTEFGKIAKNLDETEVPSDFDKGIKNFGYMTMKIIIFLVLFIFLANSILKHQYLESFIFAIAVAVGLTPELLPMIMSVTMARGSIAMAKKGVIVKKQSAIPNFGSMDILCTDKTGTLTEDKIKLVKCTDFNGLDSEKVYIHSALNSFFQTGIKNPLDNAILEFKDPMGIKIDFFDYNKIDEIPFDFQRKKMSVVVESKDKNKARLIITKGAPEEILNSTTYYEIKGKIKKLNTSAKQKIIDQYHTLSSNGFRTLAISIKTLNKSKKQTTYSKNDEKDMTFIGFASFLDPAKSDVKDTILELNSLGIRVKIITGDNELVTKKICKDIGIEIHGILIGNEINDMPEDILRKKVETTTIFARFSPSQKNRVILALQANGHVVGYMGDGINDAPSLKTADIGISVNSAVDVAKESADIVLTEKSLDVLKEGITDGRKTFGNTMKYIKMNLSSNFGNMFSYTGAVLFLPFLPMLPIQILLNNFIYDFSQITIPGDNVDEEDIAKPKKWNLQQIKKFMLVFGPISSIFDFLTFFILYYTLIHYNFFNLDYDFAVKAFQTGWFIESLTTQTLVIFFIRTKKFALTSKPSKYLILSALICVAFGWIMPFTPIGVYFGFVKLPISILLSIIGLVLLYFILIETIKRIAYRHIDL